jgi:hypothetical protein
MSTTTPLSPAEASVLIAANRAQGFVAIRATLLLLLTTGVLRIEVIEVPGFFRTRKVAHLRIASESKNAPPEVVTMLDLVRAAQADGGKITDVIKRAEKAFGPQCAQFNIKIIIPALIARGLLVEKKTLFLNTFSVTPTGDAERTRIKSDLFKTNDVARLLKSDPAQAAALAATLGTTILLSEKLTKQFQPLADAMRQRSGADTVISSDNGTSRDATTHGGSPNYFDFGCFDPSSFHLSNFDTGAINALHSGMGAFDACFTDGGGHHDGGSSGHH